MKLTQHEKIMIHASALNGVISVASVSQVSNCEDWILISARTLAELNIAALETDLDTNPNDPITD